MIHVRLSLWSQRMVVAERLAVATLSIGIRELEISTADRTWHAAVIGHGQRGIRSPRDLLWLV
jgi:hypothetical protein